MLDLVEQPNSLGYNATVTLPFMSPSPENLGVLQLSPSARLFINGHLLL